MLSPMNAAAQLLLPGFDKAGASIERHSNVAHSGASLSSTDVVAWRPRRGSADTDLLRELPELVGRSRDIERNNGVAKGGIQTVIDNVVGTGLRLSARPDYMALGKDKAWSKEWRRGVESLWASYWWTTACHAGDTMTGDQMTAQQFRAGLTNGELLALPLWITDRGDGFSTKIQTVEADRLSQPWGEFESSKQRGGIQFGDYGEPIGYWIRKTHPGDMFQDINQIGWEFVPRRTEFGRLRVIHAFDPERSGQSRGKPLLTSILPQFKQIDRYTSAEIMAAVVNAMIAMTIETPLDNDSIVDLFSKDSTAYLKARQDHAVGLKAGSMIPLFPGDKATSFLPQRPASGFGAFVENIYRVIGVAMDMPYELLMKDFSKTNYSSARAAMLEAWRSFYRRRDWLGTQWMDPIYGLWLEEMVNAGRIEAPGFYENRWAYQRCKWIGPGRGWVDPVKEADASVIRVNANLSTLEQECAEQGLDWEEVLEQRAAEIAYMKVLGLEIVTIPRSPSGYISDTEQDPKTGPQAPPAEPATAPAKK